MEQTTGLLCALSQRLAAMIRTVQLCKTTALKGRFLFKDKNVYASRN